VSTWPPGRCVDLAAAIVDPAAVIDLATAGVDLNAAG
jgi:hypothetical protein